MRRVLTSLIGVLGFFSCLPLQAQVAPTLGFDPYSTFQVHTVDNVNLKNGNVVVHIPLFSLPQLGGFKPLQVYIDANTSGWTASPWCPDGAWSCEYNIAMTGSFGASIVMDTPVIASYNWTYGNNLGDPAVYTLASAADGGVTHPMLPTYPDMTDARSIDGSGYRLVSPTGSQPYNPFLSPPTSISYSPTGVHTVYNPSTGSLSGWADADGNSMHLGTLSNLIDSVGRTINPNYRSGGLDQNAEDIASTCPNLGLTDQPLFGFSTWNPVKDPSGVPDPRFSYKICLAADYYHTDFWNGDQGSGTGWTNPWIYDGGYDGDNGGVGGNTVFQEAVGGEYVIQSVVLPDGTYWGFGYDSGHYDPVANTVTLSTGLLNKIIQPGGGTVSYTYGRYEYFAFEDTNWNQEGNDEYVWLPVVATRTENSGRYPSDPQAVTSTWAYNIAPPSSYLSTDATATVTAPDNSVTDYIFSAAGETSRKTYYDSSRANLMKEVDSSYAVAILPTPPIYDGPPMIAATPDFEITALDGVAVGTTYHSNGGGFAGTVPLCVYSGGGLYVSCSAPLYTFAASGLENLSESYDVSSGALQSTTTTYVVDDPTIGPSFAAQNLMDRPKSVVVTDGTNSKTTNYTYDESTYYAGSNLGHATSVHVLSGLASHTWFDASNYGRPYQTADVKGNQTNFTYDSTGLYIASITHANGMVDSYGYDVDLGKVTSHTDPNSQTTTYKYDTVGRPWAVRNPDVTSSDWSTVACYPDKNTAGVTQAQAAPITLPGTSTSCATGTNAMVSSEGFDGLDRKTSSTQTAPEGTIEVDTTYNNMEQVASVTNPYIDTPTGYSVSNTYDRLGRLAATTEQDGSVKTYTPHGLDMTVTDEALNQTKTTTDFIGHTTDVYEPTANNSLSSALHTHYQYNVYGLTEVDQYGNGGTPLVRKFNYDGIGRLTNVCNPEGLPSTQTCAGGYWSMTYSYPAFGSLCAGDLSLPCSKKDSRGVQTNYVYDDMNRLLQKSYPGDSTGASTVYYQYDSSTPWGSVPSTFANQIGRLALVYTGWTTGGTATGTLIPAQGSAGQFSYDRMGRVTVREDAPPSEVGVSFHSMAYGYDLAGHNTDTWYPVDQNPTDGPHIQQTFDSAGRLTQVHQGTVNYLDSATFHPNGSPAGYTYGNGVSETFSQNSRLQTTAITAGNSTATLMDRGYSYSPTDGLGGSCVAGSGARNTGNIWKITDNMPGSIWTRQFQYDCIDRLSSAQIGSTGYDYWLDSFGNMSPKLGGSAVNSFGTNNRISNLPCKVSGSLTDYDDAGNQRCDTDPNGLYRIYNYDGEERITSVATSGSPGSPFASYVYDGTGNRVRKSDATGPWAEYQWNGNQVLAEKDQDGHWTDYIYAGDKKIAKIDWEDAPLHISGHNCSSCGGHGFVCGTDDWRRACDPVRRRTSLHPVQCRPGCRRTDSEV